MRRNGIQTPASQMRDVRHPASMASLRSSASLGATVLDWVVSRALHIGQRSGESGFVRLQFKLFMAEDTGFDGEEHTNFMILRGCDIPGLLTASHLSKKVVR